MTVRDIYRGFTPALVKLREIALYEEKRNRLCPEGDFSFSSKQLVFYNNDYPLSNKIIKKQPLKKRPFFCKEESAQRKRGIYN
jgi:hypothetical protein